MRRVDWAQVRAATSERTTDVARTMRSLADHVDWSKVQPVAAQVSSALIAAVAAGRIPVGGPLGSMVARAITDQNNLGKRVAANLAQSRRTCPRLPRRHRGDGQRVSDVGAVSRGSAPLSSARPDWPCVGSTVICSVQSPASRA